MRSHVVARTLVTAAALAGIAVAGVADASTGFAATAPAASAVLKPAGAARPDASWLGQCYNQGGLNWGGGWCDGNGPNWVYQGYADCSNGKRYYGVVRWAGDRRGSYGNCPGAFYAADYGIDAWQQ